MAVRAAINGFGRIGRLVLRAIIESGRRDIEVVAVNDLGPAKTNAHLLKYDSVHGTLARDVRVKDDAIVVGREPIAVTAERDPGKLPWKKYKIDVALECTGLFADRDSAAKHLDAGAKRVLISAPANGADITVCYGINHDRITRRHKVVSNASCTTNCLTPVADILDKLVGIERGFMTTIHAYTGDQRLVDTLHGDLRRARAAAQSMIPTSTGAARAVGLVLPQLAGKLDGTAIRVPTANVSMIDLTLVAGKPTSAERINRAMASAARGRLKGVLGVVDEPLVSVDFNHSTYSAVFDLTQTQVIGDTFVRVLAWYDNEWGFSNRMADVAVAMMKAR